MWKILGNSIYIRNLVVLLFRRAKQPCPEPAHLQLGRRGERLAARHLKRLGHRILYRNYRCDSGGEIDLITRDRRSNCLVFVEVKTRSSEKWGRPLDAVDAGKQRRIRKAAQTWLRLLDCPEIPYRFDIVEIVLTATNADIRVIESAFAQRSDSLY